MDLAKLVSVRMGSLSRSKVYLSLPGNNGFQLDFSRVGYSVFVRQTELVQCETAALQVAHSQSSGLYEVRSPWVVVSKEYPGFQETGSCQKCGSEAAELWVEKDGLWEVVGHVSGHRVCLDEAQEDVQVVDNGGLLWRRETRIVS